MRFSTALRQPARTRLEQMGGADVLAGIPCFNNESTIAHVIKTVEKGMELYFPDKRCVIFVADGGSLDDTREVSKALEPGPGIERIISIYRGLPGKGSAVRSIFEAAAILNAKVCLLFDADLRSITPEWVKCMVEGILLDSYDFIAPYYTRFKYDGTITNNIVYNLTRALYGYRVRQPIGGDFAIALSLVQRYISEDVWESDVAKFGIDIWLTTTAMAHKAKIAQANLGVKIHDVKDPAEALGPMFRQVVATLLNLMEKFESTWKSVSESASVPIIGSEWNVEPEPFSVNVSKLIKDFKIGFSNYKELWRKLMTDENWQVIEKLVTWDEDDFSIEPKQWAKILYDLAAAFHHWKGNSEVLVNSMTPLYFAQVVSFVNRTKNMNQNEAEQVIEHQAEIFEQNKTYLFQRWDEDITSSR